MLLGLLAFCAAASQSRRPGAVAPRASAKSAARRQEKMGTLEHEGTKESLARAAERYGEADAGVTKAEALRRAQLALLKGEAQASATGAKDQRAELAGDNTSDGAVAPPFATDPKKPYAHPYYWAPFILIGNWR